MTAAEPDGPAPSRTPPDPGSVERPIEGSVGAFEWRGRRLVYEIRGEGDPFIMLHGLLLPSWVNGELATLLASEGNKVVLFDLLGHGRSDKPDHASEHRLEYAGEQVVALMDHLGFDQAVVGGMSLGANVSLQVAVQSPERVRALVCEMPVLERATIAAMLTLFPLLLVLRYGGRLTRAAFRLAELLPRTAHEPLNAMLDTAGDPRAMAAVMHGYTSGPVCPPKIERQGIEVPTLIIGHRRGWMHRMDDAEALARELPRATLIHARSIYELRTRPSRLVAQIGAFVDECWEAEALSS